MTFNLIKVMSPVCLRFVLQSNTNFIELFPSPTEA